MTFVAMDLEGVLIPEIWITLAERFGIEELKKTTRDEKDYDKLMKGRIKILRDNGIRFCEIFQILRTIEPYDGAREFLDFLRGFSTVAIVSDTFMDFYRGSISEKLGDPMIFCHELLYDKEMFVSGYRLRMKNAKRETVRAMQGLNYNVFAFGDSNNDLDMIRQANKGVLFRAPEHIRKENPDLTALDTYEELSKCLDDFMYKD